MARLEVQESSPIPVIRYIFTRGAGEEVAENITNNEQEFPGQKAAHRAEFFQGANSAVHTPCIKGWLSWGIFALTTAPRTLDSGIPNTKFCFLNALDY